MTSAPIVEASVNVANNNPSQDYTHPEDLTSTEPFAYCVVIDE